MNNLSLKKNDFEVNSGCVSLAQTAHTDASLSYADHMTGDG